MSHQDLGPAFNETIKRTIEAAIPGAQAEVAGGAGHFTISVVSEKFAGKSMLEQQRMVYAALTDLMKGLDSPLHAVDSLRTRVP